MKNINFSNYVVAAIFLFILVKNQLIGQFLGQTNSSSIPSHMAQTTTGFVSDKRCWNYGEIIYGYKVAEKEYFGRGVSSLCGINDCRIAKPGDSVILNYSVAKPEISMCGKARVGESDK